MTISGGRRLAGGWLWLTVGLLGWGALSFGAVYPWAYRPLLGGAVAVGALSWLVFDSGPFVARRLWIACAAVGLAVAVQLYPVSRETLLSVSPSTDAFLQQYDLVYAMSVRAQASDLADLPAGTTVAHALSVRPEATRLGLACYVAFVVMFLGCVRALNATGAASLARGVVALGTVLALVGLIQQATFNGRIYGFWVPFHTSANPFGPFVNRNHFAGWMLMALFVSVGYFCARLTRAMRHTKTDWRNRLLWFSSRAASELLLVSSVVVVMAISLVFTMSRSGIAAFAGALALLGWLGVRKLAARVHRTVAVGFLAAVLITAVGWTGVDAVGGEFVVGEWSSVGGRLDAWKDTTRMVRDFPLAGTGLNTYPDAMALYQSTNRHRPFLEAHNDYLQLAAEGGLLVGLPAMALIAFFILEVRRRFREAADNDVTYWLRVGAVVGLITIASQELVEFSLQVPGNAALFVVVAAIAVHRAPGRHPESRPASISRTPRV